MSPLVLSSATLESVEVPITCDVDPTSDVVEFQLCATGTEPADDTWKTGTWHPTKTTTAVSPLIGAGGVLTPTPGRWQLWDLRGYGKKAGLSPQQLHQAATALVGDLVDHVEPHD